VDAYTPRLDCVLPRLARRTFSVVPKCWNFNSTVLADAPCRSPVDGSLVPLCIELGITQSSYVHDCAAASQTDPECGTFLEIHRPGRKGILSEVRIKGMYTSGYRKWLISSTYKRARDRVICYDPLRDGAYELWWVHRTPTQRRVEARMPFKVVSPLCDWDLYNNRYLEWGTLGAAPAIFDTNPFAPELFLFSRPREATVDGIRPGRGMGGTFVGRTGDTYPGNAIFSFDDESAYAYSPQRPLYTVRQGVREPPNVPSHLLGVIGRLNELRRLELLQGLEALREQEAAGFTTATPGKANAAQAEAQEQTAAAGAASSADRPGSLRHSASTSSSTASEAM
jgi:hypothetical protein